MITIQKFNYLTDEERQIRTAVFIKEQGFQDEFDALDDESYHLLLSVDGVPACCCRYFPSDIPDESVIGRLATLINYRGQQLASHIEKAAEDHVRQHGAKTLALHAQVQAQPFYEKNGYIPYGDIDEEEGVPHIMMRKVL